MRFDEEEPKPSDFWIGVIIIAGVACIGWAMLGYVSELAGAIIHR